jgi:hypothetical protein
MGRMPYPDCAVIRQSPDLPAGFLPPELDGLWLDIAELPTHPLLSLSTGERFPGAVAIPTGRVEVRDDGAIAEVWELQP